MLTNKSSFFNSTLCKKVLSTLTLQLKLFEHWRVVVELSLLDLFRLLMS